MFIPSPLPPPDLGGQSGWYLLSEGQRASAWNDVGFFYTFVTQESLIEAFPGGEWYGEGPEGNTVAINELMLGDVIQYDWDGNGVWDHAAIVVNFVGADPYVATHTPDDVRHYTAFAPSYNPDITQIRYIHIERSNGYPPVKAEIQANLFSGDSDDAGTNYSTCAFSAGDNEVYLGTCQNGGSIVSDFRFNNIQIPPGAYIKYAYPIFTVDGPCSDTVNVQIYGDETGHSETFSIISPPSSRPTPSAFTPVVQWDITDPWYFTPTRERRVTPQLSSVIQHIVNRSDWASGNSLSLIIRNAGSNVRRVFAYERAVDDPAAPATKFIAAYDLTPPTTTLPFPSLATQDGHVLESSETSSRGGSYNSNYVMFYVGDDSSNKQYRGILSFDTKDLPDDAVITSAILKIKQFGIVGTNPFTTHGSLNVDIKKPFFGRDVSLAKSDFEDPAGLSGAVTFDPTPTDGWYTATLSSAAFSYINLTGATQFRLAFTLDDNNHFGSDYIMFFSGDNSTYQPQLTVEYYEDLGLLGTTP